MEDLEKIKKIYPFDTLPIEEIEEIVSIAELKTYKKNEILFKEGSEPLNFLYIILEGEVFLEKILS